MASTRITLTPAQREVINSFGRHINDHWNSGFEKMVEEASCRCTPLRKELDDLQKQQDAESRPLMDAKYAVVRKYQKKRAKLENDRARELAPHEAALAGVVAKYEGQRKEITRQINEFDREDHPRANKVVASMKPFAKAWLMQQIETGVDLGGVDIKGLTEMYAQDVAGGWQPTMALNVAKEGK